MHLHHILLTSAGETEDRNDSGNQSVFSNQACGKGNKEEAKRDGDRISPESWERPLDGLIFPSEQMDGVNHKKN